VELHGTHAAWSPKGDRIAYADNFGLIRLIRPDGTELAALGTPYEAVNWIDWSPDEQWLIVGCVWGGRPPWLVNTQTGMMLRLGWADADEASWHP
jgi:Tol biopolymer transport system component